MAVSDLNPSDDKAIPYLIEIAGSQSRFGFDQDFFINDTQFSSLTDGKCFG